VLHFGNFWISSLLLGSGQALARSKAGNSDTMVVETPQSCRHVELPDANKIFGRTPRMQEVRTKIEAAVGDNRPVLLEGESGTGKEVVARYLHLNSLQQAGTFVRVNCAAMSPRLLEMELFGSDQNLCGLPDFSLKSGSFGLAASGTLFLDEIFEIDLNLQEKLFQVFRERHAGMPGRARIVCSSSVNVQTAIVQGRAVETSMGSFGHRVTLLPLIERTEDIPELCEYLIEKFARSFSRPAPRLGPDLLEIFKRRAWPGNIRELENQIARIVIFGPDEAIGHDVQKKVGVRPEAVRRHRAMRRKGDVRRLPGRFS